MSDPIKHECGIALVRLLKPLKYYQEKYGTCFYGLQKMYLLMEKQHNRGQDGAGLASIKFDVPPGNRYISLERSNTNSPIGDIFKAINKDIKKTLSDTTKPDVDKIKYNTRFCAELMLGHLRYGTFGKNNIESCHPFLRENNWISRNLVLAGNFNLTNINTLFDRLVSIGQHPKERADTVTILEKIGHFLDEENERLYHHYKDNGYSKTEIASLIAQHLDLQNVLQQSCKQWDGGYVISGLIGHGDAFVLRDPSGIRPAYYYTDDEIIVVASERPVIQTALNAQFDSVKEITPGHALIIKKDGSFSEKPFTAQRERKSCSFERIYFSRGSDAEIYKERKLLGKNLTGEVLEAVDHDLENSVFSYIPNTAETCFYGMVEEIHNYCNKVKIDKIKKAGNNISNDKLHEILSFRPRVDKIAIKDAKLRTFITEDSERNDLVAHVYDITYGTINKGVDNLIVIDDSIVRGTTLRESILKILDRLGPKKIVLVSSAPQIRYPDCYGIDMAKLGDFVAFKAAIDLLKSSDQANIIDIVYQKCLAQSNLPDEEIPNYVRDIYEPFTPEEISDQIAKILKPEDINAEVQIIYQRIENLHKSCPEHLGDWYFSGKYPTPGGNKVANQAFINFIEGKNIRAY